MREIARDAGISVGTARDVRERLRRGDPVLPAKRRCKPEQPPEPTQLPRTLATLRNDPSQRYTDAGRNLLHWLESANPNGNLRAVDTVPPHCAGLVAEIAKRYAVLWEGSLRPSNAEERKRADRSNVRCRQRDGGLGLADN